MRDTDLTELSMRLAQLADALGGKAPARGALQVWLDVLGEVAMPDVLSIITDWPKSHTKMPAPADLLKLCRERASDRIEAEADLNKRAPGFALSRLEATPETRATAEAELAKIRAIFAKHRGETRTQKATRINREVLAAPVGTYSDDRIKAAREFLDRVSSDEPMTEDDLEAQREREAIQAEAF